MKTLTTKDLQAKLGLRYEPIAFRSLERAKSYASRCTKSMWVVLGDHDGDEGVAWVVCPADFEKLVRAGYEGA
jgi:hypothetical protein